MSFTISSWNAFSVLAALEAMLKANTALINFEGRITRGEEINMDENLMPWIGIYPLGDEFPIRTLGVGNGFRQQRLSIAVIIQNMSRTSGAACQDALGEFEKAVIDAILSDTSLGGTMDVVDNFSVSYSAPAKQASNFTIQSSVINFTAVKLVGVSGG